MARTAAPFDEGNVIGHQRGKYWHIAYSTPSGRTRESLKKWNGGVNVTNKEQAKKLARQVNDMLEQGDYGGLKQMNNSQTITFRAFVENEFLRKGPWSERTKKGMGGCLVKLCGIFGDRPLQSLKPHDFITW